MLCAGSSVRVSGSVILALAAIVTAAGQGVPTTPTREDVVRDNLERRMNDMRNLDVLSRRTAAERREAVRAQYFRPELTKDLERRRTVDDSVLTRFAEFLKAPGTGAVTLIAQSDCRRYSKVSKLEDCYQENANIREYANAYSFRENKRAVFAQSDLGLSGEYLIAARHSVQTLLVFLGRKDVADIDLSSREISFLFDFRPSQDPALMDVQFNDLANGLTVAEFDGDRITGKQNYSKAAKLQEGAVYALRSIAYRPEGAEPLGKDADVVVVFKVVALTSSGEVTIVWKELSRSPGVVMTRGEQEDEK